MRKDKTKKSYEQENIEKLEKFLEYSGTKITEEEKAKITLYLRHNNEYTLGMYHYKMLCGYDDTYKYGSDMNQYKNITVYDLQQPYLFDQKLSQLIMKYLIILENSFKAVVCNNFIGCGHYYPHIDGSKFTIDDSRKNRGFAKNVIKIYEKIIEDNKANGGYVKSLIEDIEKNKSRYEKNIDIDSLKKGLSYYGESYGKFKNIESIEDEMKKDKTLEYLYNVPIFLLVNFLDFRQALYLYRGVKNESVQVEIAKIYNCNDIEKFDKLIELMIFLRNRCAHPTRNYSAKDFEKVDKKLLESLTDESNLPDIECYKSDQIFIHLALLQYLLRQIDPKNVGFKDELYTLITQQCKNKFLRFENIHEVHINKIDRLIISMGGDEDVWEQQLWK